MSKLEKGYGSGGMQAILGDVKTYYNRELAQKANTSDLGTAAYKNSTNQVSSGSSALVESGAVKTALDGKISTSNTPGHVMNDGTIDTNAYEKSGVAETLVKDTVGWSGKNKLPLTLSAIKSANTDGTWSGNSYTYRDVVWTIQTDDGGIVTEINANGTANASSFLYLYYPSTGEQLTQDMVLNGCPAGGDDATKYILAAWQDGGNMEIDEGEGVTVSSGFTLNAIYAVVRQGFNAQNLTFHPMFRLASISDSTFEPYHATVDEVKADKVTNATSGHLAGLDANGNLTDSGVSPTEEVTVEGNPVTFDSPFEQDAKSVVVSVKPIQDLHGYDHPWPAGGGKNKVNPTANPFGISAGTGATNYEPTSHAYIAKGLAGETVTVSRSNHTSSGYFWYGAYAETALSTGLTPLDYGDMGDNLSATISVPVGTGILVIFTGADEPIDLQVEIGSSATSFAPYSNICPISGIDEVEIGVEGWHDIESFEYGYVDESVGSDISAVIASTRYAVTPIYNCTSAKIAVKSNDLSKFLDAFVIYGKNGVVVKNVWIRLSDYDTHLLYQDDVEYDCLRLMIGAPQYAQVDSSKGEYQILYDTRSHTTTIPLPSTLYGGEVDVTEGSGDNRFGFISGSSISDLQAWATAHGVTFKTTTSDDGNLRVEFAEIAEPTSSDTVTPPRSMLICNELDNVSDSDLYWEPISGVTIQRNGDVRFAVNGITTEADMTAWLTANPIQIAYKLATPTTISFDPTDVELLEGTNVVTTNAEKVAVTYKAGILATLGDIDDLNDKVKTKLDKKDVAKVEGTNASKPYAIGDYMLRSDGFYVVTQAIAQNAPITSNNTEKTTVGNELSNKADSDIDGDMRPITSNAVHDIKQSLLNKIPNYPIEWFDFTQDIVYNENITFGTEYTFTIPTTSSNHYYLQNSKLLWMAYKLPSEQQDNRGRSNYAVVNVWGGMDSRNFVMATFFDIDDDGNMFYVKIYDYHDETNQFKLKADYVNGYTPSSPMSLLINYIRQSPERWR